MGNEMGNVYPSVLNLHGKIGKIGSISNCVNNLCESRGK